jgi:hypothetical protein
VVRGIEGFGANSHLHTARILRLSEDLPVLIDIVDTDEHIERLLPIVEEMVGDGLVTVDVSTSSRIRRVDLMGLMAETRPPRRARDVRTRSGLVTLSVVRDAQVRGHMCWSSAFDPSAVRP